MHGVPSCFCVSQAFCHPFLLDALVFPGLHQLPGRLYNLFFRTGPRKFSSCIYDQWSASLAFGDPPRTQICARGPELESSHGALPSTSLQVLHSFWQFQLCLSLSLCLFLSAVYWVPHSAFIAFFLPTPLS